MDVDLPGYAWDLLPYKKKPFDLYKLLCGMPSITPRMEHHMLQYKHLGCQFGCNFYD